MMWWIAALLFVFLALDVVVKSTGASAKPPSPTRVEIVNAVADRKVALRAYGARSPARNLTDFLASVGANFGARRSV